MGGRYEQTAFVQCKERRRARSLVGKQMGIAKYLRQCHPWEPAVPENSRFVNSIVLAFQDQMEIVTICT
jgi:hypothetical protein